MNIIDICTKAVRFCRPQDNVAAAASVMWECDCGAIPVLDDAGKLIGVITDRDICIAVATRKQYAHDIPVSEVMSGMVISCKTGDPVKEALRLMREAKIRRLPVLDDKGMLRGIVSVNDIILAAHDVKVKAVKEALLQEIMLTLMAISQHHKPRAEQPAGARVLVPGA